MPSGSPCDAKIRPLPDDTEITCEDIIGHGPEHAGSLRDYAYPGSKTVVRWHESDRRTFRGEWKPCVNVPLCILPDGHRGRCAI